MRQYGETGSRSDYQEDQAVSGVARWVPMGRCAVVTRLGTACDSRRALRRVGGFATVLPPKRVSAPVSGMRSTCRGACYSGLGRASYSVRSMRAKPRDSPAASGGPADDTSSVTPIAGARP
jgi:hypothetical protein